MRSISTDSLSKLNAQVTSGQKSPQTETLNQIIKQFPEQFAAAIKQLPAPVIAPPPKGTWIIDVNRDKDGKMSQMVANFHRTK